MQGHANTLNFNFEIVGFSLGKKLFITAQTELEVFYSSETSSPNARRRVKLKIIKTAFLVQQHVSFCLLQTISYVLIMR